MIVVENLRFSYPYSKKEILKDLNFKVEKGQIFGFLGPSGAGKSTTQRILIGLMKHYEGKAIVMDKEIRDWRGDYYEKIGVSFELPNLYHKLTAIENLNFIRSFYNGPTEEPRKLLKLVGLEDKANIKVSKYSKGMKMRLNFVRSLIHQPQLIFLDEPTSGLDPVSGKRIKEIILQKKEEGKTIFLTTHNMQVAEELCDQVAFIVDGEIKLISSPKQLKLRGAKSIVTVEYESKGMILSKEFPLESIGENQQFIKCLQENKVKTMHSHEPTLEDVFIEVTGRGLI
ncbi:ABC transporter ATP-binding protein [Alkaliphilus sp. MSJ-5]|uniref:ABC transporter ATP-binding protein n=1 Tax=Alkaliphilus flagellatus TaxID=2841507 RepID=A0ABS6G0N0_9FIRM|nr:ABC transporter ATP-binding protein [Alkaliphilus flagellatus]MBU5676056.1 ABC transporter ATP-binding protein [Alkaliphilus flagellatus]